MEDTSSGSPRATSASCAKVLLGCAVLKDSSCCTSRPSQLLLGKVSVDCAPAAEAAAEGSPPAPAVRAATAALELVAWPLLVNDPGR
jgi:hypothetical protein